MIYNRHCCCVWACLLLIGGLTTASFGDLPAAIITSPDPSPQRSTIDSFVDADVKALSDPDTSKWGPARSQLIGQVAKQGVTPGFLDVYADSLNTQLLTLLKSKDARVRLNAAIIAARIAAKADNARLNPVTQALLKDNSDAVVLWGLQTAKYVIPALLSVSNTRDADATAKLAVQATENHMTPAIIEEAYRTLLLDPQLPASDPHYISEVSVQAMGTFLPNPIALYEFRIKLYDEVDAPAQPVTDTWASTFFVNEKVWSAQNPTQQGQTLNLTMALLKGAAKQQAAAASPEMLDVIRRAGQAFHVAADLLKKPALKIAADKVAGLPASSAPDEINTAVDNLDAAVKALGLPGTPAATASTP